MSIHTPRVSEARLQVLVPAKLKARLEGASRRLGVSTGEFVRRALEATLHETEKRPVQFPFGDRPIRTGRRRGSTNHDRPE